MLQSLPQLERLTFIRANFSAHKVKERLKICELSISNNVESESNPNSAAKYLDVFSGERLKRLCLKSPIYASKVFPSLTQQGVLKHLAHLSVTINSCDIPILFKFLKFCPKLNDLSISLHKTSPGLPSLPPLPSSVIPSLRSINVPRRLIKKFLPRRPINTICLGSATPGCWDQLQAIIPHISLCTGTITDLDLGNVKVEDSKIFTLVATSFPNLTRLAFHPLTYQPLVSKLAYDRLPSYFTAKAEDLKISTRSCMKLHSDAGLETRYPDILHYIALDPPTPLPATIEELFLRNTLFRSGKPSKGEWGAPTHDAVRVYDRTYTVPMIHRIFERLSVQHPNLNRVIVGELKDFELSWTKGADSQWTWFGWKY